MTRSLLTLVLLFFAVASYAGIVSERPVSTIVYGPAPGQRFGPAAASDGRDFLVTWVDAQRSRLDGAQFYAARMNASGEFLDPLAIRIANGSKVVFLGNVYLVYWTERSDGSSVPSLMGVRISRDGVLLDSAPRILASSPGGLDLWDAASNGNRTVILFHGVGLTGKTIVLDRDGNLVTGPKMFTNFGVTSAIVASNGRGFLIAWRLGDSTYGTLLDENGAVTAPEKFALSSGRIPYDIASDGDGYVAILANGTDFAARHVSSAGELLEFSPVSIKQDFRAFVFAAGSYLLMDGDPAAHTIGVRRLDRTGKPVSDYVPLAEAPALGFGGTLASNGYDTAAYWTELRGSVQAVNGGVIHANAAELTKAPPISLSANAQYAPRAATNGRNIAAVWNESDGVYAGRLTLDGQMLDGRGIHVAGAGAGAADILFDGANYLIGWAERSPSNLATSVKITRLFPDFGTILDPTGITVASSPCVNALSLSVGSASTLVAWSDCKHILANTVDQSGLVGTAAVVTPPETRETAAVFAAWNGREWLLAWEDRISIPTVFEGTVTQSFIKAARLSASLTLLDPHPISLTDTTFDVSPFVASDGHDFLVAWTLPVLVPRAAMAQRVSADGSLLGTANGVRIGGGSVTSVVWDGLQYDVAFSSSSYGRQSTLYVTHVAAGGPIEGTAAQSVASNAVTPDAKLIVTSPGQVIAVYSIVPPDPIYGGVERVFVNAPHAIRERAIGVRRNP